MPKQGVKMFDQRHWKLKVSVTQYRCMLTMYGVFQELNCIIKLLVFKRLFPIMSERKDRSLLNNMHGAMIKCRIDTFHDIHCI